MADLNVTNLFDLSYDQINAMKKKDLVNHVENLKGKVAVDATIKKVMQCNIAAMNVSEQSHDRKRKS